MQELFGPYAGAFWRVALQSLTTCGGSEGQKETLSKGLRHLIPRNIEARQTKSQKQLFGILQVEFGDQRGMWYLVEQRVRGASRRDLEEHVNVVRKCKTMAEEGHSWSGLNQVREQAHTT